MVSGRKKKSALTAATGNEFSAPLLEHLASFLGSITFVVALQDALYFEAFGRAVAVIDYDLKLTRLSSCVLTPKGIEQCL